MKEGKDAVHLWWENDCDGQPAKGTSLRPDDEADQRVPLLRNDLFDI